MRTPHLAHAVDLMVRAKRFALSRPVTPFYVGRTRTDVSASKEDARVQSRILARMPWQQAVSASARRESSYRYPSPQ